ncbi:MAG: hypothetical protein ACP5MK_03835, partial [Candidatus Micrarchaeia archaeon]
HGLDQLRDEFTKTPLKYKEDATEKEIKEGLYAVIEPRIEIGNRLNNLRGEKLYQYLYRLNDKTLSANYQILSRHSSLLKRQLWEAIRNAKNQRLLDGFLEAYLPIAGFNPKNFQLNKRNLS